MEQPKLYGALLNGVMKRNYEGDTTITAEFLREAVFAANGVTDITEEEVAKACETANRVMERAAYEDYDVSQMEKFLKLSKNLGLTDVQKKAFLKFWLNNRSKIHEAVCKRAAWDNTLERVAWRIDVKARTMAAASAQDSGAAQAAEDEQHEPVAIVELHINRADAPGKRDVARFELDREHLAQVLRQVTDIEKEIQATAGK